MLPKKWFGGFAASSSWGRYVLPLALAALFPPAVFHLTRPAAGQTTQSDVQVSDPGLWDMEFTHLPGDNRFVWATNGGQVWIGTVDLNTGNFVPSSGKVTKVTSGAYAPIPVGNGPEWVFSAEHGPEVAYTVKGPNGVRQLGLAYLDGSQWIASTLANSDNEAAPIGSLDVDDANPRLAYTKQILNGSAIKEYWRFTDSSADEQMPGDGTQGLRWVPGMQAIGVNSKVNGQRQAFLYDINSKQFKQLTADSGSKTSVFFWQAPEYNNELLFMTLINNANVGIYRQIGGQWQRIYTIQPQSYHYIESPEPFVYNGKSYVFMVTKDNPDTTNRTDPSDVWIAGIDANTRFYKQCSDSTKKVRKDPEYFVTNKGLYIYFSAPTSDPSQPAAQFRCDPGLGAPQ